jgi:protein SCO1/2
MKRAAWALLVVAALCAGTLLAGLTLPNLSRSATGGGDSDLAALAFRPHPGARLPLATTLTDETGRSVAFGSFFKTSPVILVLDYLHCTSLCGVTLRNLVAGTLDKLPLEPGRDYQLVAVSIDPRDTPAEAAAARAKYAGLLGRSGGDRGMHFLTASAAAVREIADAVGFPYRYDSLLDAYIHPAGFVIGSPDGVISRYVEGISIAPRDLVTALADAEQDKSQDLLTRLVLLCHVQGAPLGRFTVPVLAAFTAANLAAGFALIAHFAAIRRRRHG